MLEQLRYVNHLGETIEFGKKGIFANSNDLRNYEYTYDSSRNRAENFRTGVVSKTIPVVISAESKKRCIDIKNRLYEVCEKDIIAEQKGKLYIGDYYLECYVFSSAKSNYLDTNTTMNLSLKIVADKGSWRKLETIKFLHDNATDTGKGYDYDYEYDYSRGLDNRHRIDVDDIKSCDFRLRIIGPVIDPCIYIDNHRYSVNCTVTSGELLVIDTVSDTITLVSANGYEHNMYRYRDRVYDVFQKIEPGYHTVSWNSKMDFELTLIHERGEPKW
jgi:hypothetical protein